MISRNLKNSLSYLSFATSTIHIVHWKGCKIIVHIWSSQLWGLILIHKQRSVPCVNFRWTGGQTGCHPSIWNQGHYYHTDHKGSLQKKWKKLGFVPYWEMGGRGGGLTKPQHFCKKFLRLNLVEKHTVKRPFLSFSC